MGMFDSIRCEFPLPLEATKQHPELNKVDFQKKEFQTKCLDNSLSYYTIREDGTLWQKKVEGHYEPGNENSDNWLDQLGQFVTDREWEEQVFITQYITFYTYIRDDSNENDYWIEFKAHFKNGTLTEIDNTELRVTNNTNRKEDQKKWVEYFLKSSLRRQKWWYKYLYLPYSKIVRFIFKKFYRLADQLFKIERFLTPL